MPQETLQNQAPVAKPNLNKTSVEGVTAYSAAYTAAITAAISTTLFAIAGIYLGIKEKVPFSQVFKELKVFSNVTLYSLQGGFLGGIMGFVSSKVANTTKAQVKPYIENLEAERDDLRSALHAQRILQERGAAELNVAAR